MVRAGVASGLVAAALCLPITAGVAAAEPGPSRCGGTLLQLQVSSQGSSSVDRFQFSLGLEAEASSAAEALELLNQRLSQLRSVVTPLATGPLTVPAPSSTSYGSGQMRHRASTSVSGVVSTANYDPLIQAAGRQPGVSLQGFTALPASGSEAQLQTKLLREALADGQRQAQTTASALGLKTVRLLRIDQRSGGGPRPMPMLAARSFNPEEAPPPERSVSLGLDYCLF